MSNYAEVIEALRRLREWETMDYEDNLKYADEVLDEALSAIEELQHQIADPGKKVLTNICETCRYATTGNTGVLYCMGQKGMPRTNPYDSCESWKSVMPTNADRIRAMTNEELAELLTAVAETSAKKLCESIKTVDVDISRCDFEPLMKSHLDWLEQEADNGV